MEAAGAPGGKIVSLGEPALTCAPAFPDAVSVKGKSFFMQRLTTALIAAVLFMPPAAVAAYLKEPIAVWKTALKTAGVEPQ